MTLNPELHLLWCRSSHQYYTKLIGNIVNEYWLILSEIKFKQCNAYITHLPYRQSTINVFESVDFVNRPAAHSRCRFKYNAVGYLIIFNFQIISPNRIKLKAQLSNKKRVDPIPNNWKFGEAFSPSKSNINCNLYV